MEERCWATPTTFRWREDAGKGNHYTLSSATGTAGTLTFSGWGSASADAVTAFGAYHIRSKGLWSSVLLVTDARTGAVVAECTRSFLSGERTVRFTDGAVRRWTNTRFWSQTYSVVDDHGGEVLTLAEGGEHRGFRDLFRTHGHMELKPHREDPPRAALLALLGWYFFITVQQESSTFVSTAYLLLFLLLMV